MCTGLRDGTGAERVSRRGVRLFLCWLPGLLIAGGLAFDMATPKFTGSPFFSAAPLVAAPLFSRRGTAVTGLAAAAAVFGLNLLWGNATRIQGITEMATAVTIAGLALLINRIVLRGDRRLASARGIAEAAQRAVLPVPAGRLGGLHIAARYEAAQTDARIGGDLYAVQETPYGVRLIVGDVRGKGLDAVEAVAIVIGAFREAAEREMSLAGLAVRLERALQREGSRREGLDQFEGFTTAVLAEVSPAADPADPGWLRLLNRGHPAPLLLFADGRVLCVEPGVPALPLGMEELGSWPDRVEEIPFPQGATLLLYTDGVTEARDARGVFYDPRKRLRGRLFASPEQLLDVLVEDVGRHTGGESADDMALLAVSRPGAGQPERRRTVGLARGAGHDRSGTVRTPYAG